MRRIRRQYMYILKQDEYQEELYVLMAPIVLPDPPIPFLVQQANIKISLDSRLVYHVLLDTFALQGHRATRLDLTNVL